MRQVVPNRTTAMDRSPTMEVDVLQRWLDNQLVYSHPLMMVVSTNGDAAFSNTVLDDNRTWHPSTAEWRFHTNTTISGVLNLNANFTRTAFAVQRHTQCDMFRYKTDGNITDKVTPQRRWTQPSMYCLKTVLRLKDYADNSLKIATTANWDAIDGNEGVN